MSKLAAILLAALCIPFAALAQVKAPADAELAARNYMSAFLTGDVQAAANLMDTDALAKLREVFMAELAKVEGTEKEKGFLAYQGIARPTGDIKAMTPFALYVMIVESNHRLNREAFEAMKATKVEVIGSALTPGGAATVRLRLTKPSGTGASSEETALSMRLVPSGWKVVSSAP